MTKSHEPRPATEDIDLHTLGRALWRAKGWILGLTFGAGVATFIVLSMMRPLYTSEARVLVQNDESSFTRPASDQGRDQQRTLDEQEVQSQVQVLTSRDLAVEVIKALDLTDDPDFAKDGGTGPIMRFLKQVGLAKGAPKSEEEKAANTFADHLSVFQLEKSSVIVVNYTSGDPTLAAKIANKLADVYIDWQREAKLEQTKDATTWLSAQIDVLRKKVAEAEAAAEQFRSSQGLFAGTNNVTLNAQQLSELNSQLILAKAQKSEAEARARLIKKMLVDKGDIDATPEVLKSELIARLIDQRVQVQRQLAELSATLLPSHPRIKQLTSELADVRTQIRDEAIKIIKSLENEAEVASARETSLRGSLNDVKTQASGLSEAEIQLRALEREAKAQRDLLESYLVRYRDASARHGMGSVPAQAAVVSRAHASILPSFPKKVPLSLFAAVAVALLSLAYVLARELIGAPDTAHARAPESEPRGRLRRRPAEPAVASVANAMPQTIVPPEPVAPTAAPASPEPAILMPRTAPVAVAAGKHAKLSGSVVGPGPSDALRVSQAELPLATPSRASADSEPASASRPKRPSFLPARRTEEAKPATAEASLNVPQSFQSTVPAAPSSAAGFLERLRRGLSPAASEAQTPAAGAPIEGWLNRIRGTRKGEAAAKPSVAPLPKPEPMPVLRTNDLRHYLNQRLAASAAEAANDPGRKGKPEAPKTTETEKLGPVLKSLDAVVNHILASGKGSAPRALLVAGAMPKVDATAEAISIARALVARHEQAVLVDIARGAATVSGPLGLPRAPGLTDLTASKSGFEDVVRIDSESPLQVITAGNPKLIAKGDENERFARVFEALIQAYDTVVLHADRDAMRRLTPALKFELPLVVAVLPAGAGASSSKDDLTDFSALGCPVLIYEQAGKQPRSRLLGRVAAIKAS